MFILCYKGAAITDWKPSMADAVNSCREAIIECSDGTLRLREGYHVEPGLCTHIIEEQTS